MTPAVEELLGRLQPPPAAPGRGARIELGSEDGGPGGGLGRLVLTLMRLLQELLERQALERIDSGQLPAEDAERLGLTLQKQAEELERLRVAFGLDPEDLNLDLGPLGKLI